MARNHKNRRRDWRQIVFLVIALLIALTMILAYFPGLGVVPK